MRAPLCVVIALSMIGVSGAVVQKVEAAEEPGLAPEAPGEAAPRPRRARPAPAPDAPSTSEPSGLSSILLPARSDHRYQTGIAVMPGKGFRVIVPYKENVPCGDKSGNASKRVCTNYTPFFLDLQLSFGVSKRLDLLLDARFGIGADPATLDSHQFALAPGVRFWLDQDVDLKFYSTVQLVLDQTQHDDRNVKDSDFGLRNANGLMYDPIRNVGFFVQFGETIGFMRWFRMELDLGLGVQLRFP